MNWIGECGQLEGCWEQSLPCSNLCMAVGYCGARQAPGAVSA